MVPLLPPVAWRGLLQRAGENPTVLRLVPFAVGSSILFTSDSNCSALATFDVVIDRMSPNCLLSLIGYAQVAPNRGDSVGLGLHVSIIAPVSWSIIDLGGTSCLRPPLPDYLCLFFDWDF